MRGGGKGGNVHHIDGGVADAFAVNQFGARVGVGGDLFGLGRVDKTHFDALLGQGVGEQVVSAAIQGFGGDDVVARFGQSLHGIGNRRHATGHAQGRQAAFYRGQTLFQHGGGRVHDAGVDVAGHGQVKQIRAVLGVVEGIAGGLVNRHGHGFGGWLRLVTGMNGLGF